MAAPTIRREDGHDVLVHDEGADCWCEPDVGPIGIGHHTRVGEWHEVGDHGDPGRMPMAPACGEPTQYWICVHGMFRGDGLVDAACGRGCEMQPYRGFH